MSKSRPNIRFLIPEAPKVPCLQEKFVAQTSTWKGGVTLKTPTHAMLRDSVLPNRSDMEEGE